jgi:hypothetical protein
LARSLEAEQAAFEVIPLPPTEAEWLAIRKPFFNASLAGCLFDEHEYVTLGDVCTEWLKPAEFDIVDEDRAKLFRRGLQMEPYISNVAEEMLGVKLSQAPMYRRGVMLATPDRIVENGDLTVNETWGVEIKSTRMFLRGQIKRSWWWQCQAQMWCADWERVVVAALDASLEVAIFEVWRDEDAIRQMMLRAEALVETLEWGELPAGVELSAQNVTYLWPKDTGAEHEVGADLVGPLAEYLEARKNEKRWGEIKEKARDRCVAELGPDSTATIDGIGVFTYKASKDREVVDTKTMIAENPEIAAKYTSTKAGPRTFRPNEKGIGMMSRRMSGDEEF